MNVKRLRVLRDALIAHAKGRAGNLLFDLNSWANIPDAYQQSSKTVEQILAAAKCGENHCGTTACALGLAATIPEFKRAGLHFDNYKALPDVYFKDDREFWAAASFFGISRDDAVEIFNPAQYEREDFDNPIAVADKITALLHTA